MRKQLFYLANNQLTARLWQGGKLSEGRTFPNDEAGWKSLSNYLIKHLHTPIFLLMDLVEEDFQRDTIPHVYGGTRKNLIERRLQQLYRDTPFRHASTQGREKTGRKDDRILFNALTNASLIKPWMDTILAQQVPIAGIYSTALLSAGLFKQFQLGNEATLFITHQSAGLRQNFFQDGYLRFSRLTKLYSEIPEDVAEVTRVEVEKTRLFLSNARQLQRGEMLNVVALDNLPALQCLQNLNLSSDTTNYQFLTPQVASKKLGFRTPADIQYLDTLFLYFLGKKSISTHFALQEQSSAYSLWKSRILLYVLSAGTIGACLFWSGANFVETIESKHLLNQINLETQKNESRYQRVIESMPKTEVKPHNMKAAVDLHELLIQHNSTPNRLFEAISQVLNRLPQLKLNELNWEISDKRELVDTSAMSPAQVLAQAQAEAQTQTTDPGTPPAKLIGVPARPSELVVLKGEVVPFKDDYRTALESVHAFVAELTKNSAVKVNVVHPPLDVRPSVPIDGEAGGSAAPKAEFELQILWIPEN